MITVFPDGRHRICWGRAGLTRMVPGSLDNLLTLVADADATYGALV